MTFVIRSMSTTDYRPAQRCGNTVIPAQQPKPYHIYLRRPELRHGAYWSRSPIDMMKFETAEEAQAEAKRVSLTGFQVVPINAEELGLPNYWER